MVTVSHSVISKDSRYDGTAVRNVEVFVRDNDTPGVYVVEVGHGTSVEDRRTVVIEGDGITSLTDDLLVRLAMAPTSGTVVVGLAMDAETDAAISVSAVCPPENPTCWNAATRTITFDSTNWDKAVRLIVTARDDSRRQDPRTAVITFVKDASSTAPSYVFPSLYAPPVRVAVEVWDDETPNVVVQESGGSTLVVLGGATDDEFLRLTKVPTAPVQIAVLTDGLVDVVSIDGVTVTPADYAVIGGYQASRAFEGSVSVTHSGGRTTLTRTGSSDLGSFLDDGLRTGQFLRIVIGGCPVLGCEVYVHDVTDTALTLTTQLGALPATYGVLINRLTRAGLWSGAVTVEIVGPERRLVRTGLAGTELPGWLTDGFLEGQWVEVCKGSQCARFKIELIRGTNKAKDDKIQFTAFGAAPVWMTDGTAHNVTVTRIAPVAVFTTANWWEEQRVEFAADTLYSLPPGRENVKVFPVSTHLLSKLRGPLAVEGGVAAGADRSLKNGVKLPGEKDAPLFNIAAQAPESSQIDVLNIFNDSSQSDGTGTMTSTTLTGFGMAGELNFSTNDPSLTGAAFGETLVVPGGISFGAVSAVGGSFGTSGAKSTIEVLNLLLGQGNDNLVITGTLDPLTAVTCQRTARGGADRRPVRRHRRRPGHLAHPHGRQLGRRRLHHRPAGDRSPASGPAPGRSSTSRPRCSRCGRSRARSCPPRAAPSPRTVAPMETVSWTGAATFAPDRRRRRR